MEQQLNTPFRYNTITMHRTVCQVNVGLALKYAEKHYPDFRLKIPKEDAAVDFEIANGTKYIVFYPKDGDKTICYQKIMIKQKIQYNGD